LEFYQKKKIKILEQFVREQWHVRQSKPTSSTEKLSKNQQFKRIQIDEKIYQYIKDNNLGLIKHPPLNRKLRGNFTYETKERTPCEKLFHQKFKFLGSAEKISSFLPPTLPEIGFVGRSNVGKSSLINALTNSKIVRTENKPGTTKTINWFQLSNQLMLVDLPGYGFAFAKEEIKNEWQNLMKDYLKQRSALKRVILLIDSRQGIKQSDVEMMKILDSTNSTFQIVLTKCDLVEQKKLARTVTLIKNNNLNLSNKCIQRIMMVSSKNRAGLYDLRKELFGFTNISTITQTN